MQSRVLVVCKQDETLVSLDPHSLTVTWRADLSDTGHEVVASRDGVLGLVPLYGPGGVGGPGRSGDGIDVIALETGVRVGTIALPPGSRPHFADWGRDSSLFVTAEGIDSALSVDVAAWERAHHIPGHPAVAPHRVMETTHPQSHMLVVAPDGRHVYTADVHPGKVTEIDVASGRRRCLALADRINRISLTADGRTAYVADQDDPRMAVVNVRTMTLARWIALPAIGFGTATAGAGRLVIALRQASRLALLDTGSGRVLGSCSVPDGPQRVVISDDGRTVYATCSPENVVVAVDIETMQVVAEGSPGAVQIRRTVRPPAAEPRDTWRPWATPP